MSDVTVFSAAGCHKCLVVKTHLKTKQVPFTEVRADLNPAVHDAVVNAVGRQLPVIMAFRSDDDEVPDIITDYHPDDLEALRDPSVPIPDRIATG